MAVVDGCSWLLMAVVVCVVSAVVDFGDGGCCGC